MNVIINFFYWLFSVAEFPSRWNCGSGWSTELGLVHILSDIIIFLSYISIPLLLVFFICKRKDIPFLPILWLFVTFITLCGLSHLVEASLFWYPWYRFLGLIKALTAFVSLITAIALIRIIPQVLQIPSLAAARARYEFIVESTSDAIVTYDNNYICTSANRGAEKMFGYKIAELIGNPISVLFPQNPFYFEETKKELETMKQTGIVNLNETTRWHKSGKLLHLLTSYSQLMDEQKKFVGICSISKDLTKKKELENQLAKTAKNLLDKNRDLRNLNKSLQIKNEEINSFAHAASHDLKSPLRVITNFAFLFHEASKDKIGAEANNFLITINEQAHQMGRFIDDLSAYFQLGSETFTKEKINCEQLIHSIVTLLTKPIGMKVDISVKLEPLLAPRIPLQIVLQNLISNAIQHHHDPENGSIWITGVRIKKTIVFKIRDDGPGISPLYHEKIFQVFQTLEPRGAGGGSGIGLSLVKRVLQRYGGTIKLLSDVGKGSTFEVIWLIHLPEK